MADWTPPTQDRVEGYFKELNNWGRWGHDDQRGTANLVTAAKRAQATALVRTGRTVSLARDIGAQPALMYHVTFPSGRERADVVLDRFDLVYHGFTITHIDALCHVSWDGELFNGRPFKDSLTAAGATWCPIDAYFDGITSRGVLLDVAAGRPEGYVTVGKPVTPRELDAVAARAGVRVEWQRRRSAAYGSRSRPAARAPITSRPPGDRDGRWREADLTSRLGRARERVVGGLDLTQPRQHVGRHRGAASRGQADVQRHQLVGRGQVALGRVVHRVNVVHALGVVGEQHGREAQGVAAADLAVVGDVRLQAERRHVVAGAVRRVEPHPRQERVRRVVEDDQVVAHVHVPVVVDPLRTHDVAVLVEGRGQAAHERPPSAHEMRMRLRATHA
jgi:hypothetical protein